MVKKRAHELQLVREKSPRAVGVAAAEMIGRRVHVDGTGEQGVIESSGHGYFTVRIAHGETIRKRGHELIVDDERSPAKAARADEAGAGLSAGLQHAPRCRHCPRHRHRARCRRYADRRGYHSSFSYMHPWIAGLYLSEV